jgi:hypothetical protein
MSTAGSAKKDKAVDDAPRLSTMGALAERARAAISDLGDAQFDPCAAAVCSEETPVANTQSEMAIAVDSTGQHVVVGFNDFRGFALATVSLSGFMWSDDGGATFHDGGPASNSGKRVSSARRDCHRCSAIPTSSTSEPAPSSTARSW